jgi:hypothetical protein
MAKLNTDGAFVSPQEAGAGLVLRDHTGAVLGAASRNLRSCADATEAELVAIEVGVVMAISWTTLNFTVETDCSEAIHLLKENTPSTSIHASRVEVIRELLRERDVRIIKINREANCVSHELAKLGRVLGRTGTWFSSFPPEVAQAIHSDCNSILI